MNRYAYRDRMLTVNELSELCGVQPHTLRDRIRRGYSIEQAIRPTPIHDSVEHFCEASYYKDWVGMSINDLYEIYWRWCNQNGYNAITKQGFSRQVRTMYPQLKTIPTGKGLTCKRIIRLRS